jgi:hypothetical protein
MSAIRPVFVVAVLAWLSHMILYPRIPEMLPVQDSDVFVGLTLAGFSLLVMFIGLVRLALDVFRRDPARDREHQTMIAVSLGLVVAWIVLVGLVIGSMGYVSEEPAIVCGTLAAGVVGGLFYASPSPRRPGGWLTGFALGLVVAAVLSNVLSWLALFSFMTIPGGALATSSWAGPLLWLAGWGVAEAAWGAGRQPFGIGVAAGTFEIGLLFLGNV